MIPKIAHFHWCGGPMGWLRTAGLASFMRHNPGWEVRVHGTHPAVGELQLKTLAHSGDLTRWYLLRDVGGLSVALDAIFWRKIPDEWLTKPIAATVDTRPGVVKHRILQMSLIGAEAGTAFMRDCIIEGMRRARAEDTAGLDYQEFGVNLLERTFPRYVDSHFDIPKKALCWTGCGKRVNELWGTSDPEPPPEAIGVHWYGGHPSSKKHEPKAFPRGTSYIERIAAKELGFDS